MPMQTLSSELLVEVMQYLGGLEDPRPHARSISRAFADAFTVGRFRSRVFPQPKGSTWALLELNGTFHKQVWSFEVEQEPFQVKASFLDWSPSCYRASASSCTEVEKELGAAHNVWRALLKTEDLLEAEDDALGSACLTMQDSLGVRKQPVSVASLAEVVTMLGKPMHGMISRRRLPESAAWRRARALSA